MHTHYNYVFLKKYTKIKIRKNKEGRSQAGGGGVGFEGRVQGYFNCFELNYRKFHNSIIHIFIIRYIHLTTIREYEPCCN